MKLPEPLGALLGEIESGAITNFFGQPGTGKTNLCLLAALECVKAGGRVVFIDTEGGLSKERARQVSGGSELLASIELVEPRTMKEQELAVEVVQKSKPCLVILDSAVALYRIEHAELADGVPESDKRRKMDALLGANRSLSRQMSMLSKVANEMKIPVIITAHAFKGWDSGNYDVVGGDAIKYWSKSMVYLEKTGKDSERRATIIKHRSREEGGSAKFIITGDGIKPSSGFRIF